MFVKSAVVVALFTSFVAAQTTANSTIDPGTVDPSLRAQWCGAEINTCGTLCGGLNDANVCDPSLLTYTCTCASNSSQPGLQYYTQTLPTFICEQIYANCIAAGHDNQAAQKVCTANREKNCGKISPDNFTAEVSSTSSSPSTSPTAASSTPSGTSASSSSSKAAAATMAATRDFSSGVLVAGVAAAFGFML